MITFSAINAGQSARLAAQQNAMRFGAQLVNPGRVVVDDEDPPRDVRSATAVATRYILPLIKAIEPQLAALVAGDDLPGVVKPYPVLVRSAMGQNFIGLGIQHDVPGEKPVCTESHYDQRIQADEADMETADTVLASFKELVQRRKIFLATGREPMHRTEFGDL